MCLSTDIPKDDSSDKLLLKKNLESIVLQNGKKPHVIYMLSEGPLNEGI